MLPVAILAGGLATRIRPLSLNVAKSMVEIDGLPFIDWQLKLLSNRGIRNVVLCVGYKKEQIQAYVSNGSKWGLRVEYSEDGKQPLGTAGALRKALPLLDSKFMVLYGDSYLRCDYTEIVQQFERINSIAMMTVFENKGDFDKSNVKINNGKVVEYSKSRVSEKYSFIDYGLNCFGAEVFSSIAPDTYSDLSDVLEDLAGKGLLNAYLVNQRFYEIGSIRGIEDFGKYLKETENEL